MDPAADRHRLPRHRHLRPRPQPATISPRLDHQPGRGAGRRPHGRFQRRGRRIAAMTIGVSSAKNPSGRPWGKSKMRKYIGNLAAIAVAAALGAGGALPAMAHAVIVSASPTADQHVAAGKLAVRIEFNTRIDKVRSRLQVMAPAGAKTEDRKSTRLNSSHSQISYA